MKYFAVLFGLILGMLATFSSCSKDISGIRGQVVIKEANTEIHLTADDVEVILYDGDNPEPVKSTITDVNGEFTFQKIKKQENWKIKCATTVNGIIYATTLNNVETDGKSVTTVKLILEH